MKIILFHSHVTKISLETFLNGRWNALALYTEIVESQFLPISRCMMYLMFVEKGESIGMR